MANKKLTELELAPSINREDTIYCVIDNTSYRASVGQVLQAGRMTVDHVDATAAYHYYGGHVGANWKINRYDTSDYALSVADATSNDYPSLSEAWANREGLIYASA